MIKIYIEPYIFILKNKNKTFFYNTLNGEMMDLSNNIILQRITNNRITSKLILNKYLNDNIIKELLDLQDKGYLRILKKGESPIQTQYFDLHIPNTLYHRTYFFTSKSYMQNISIFINTNNNKAQIEHEYHRQVLVPIKEIDYYELDSEKLVKIINNLRELSFAQINIIGNPFEYKNLDLILYNLEYYHKVFYIDQYSLLQVNSSIDSFNKKINKFCNNSCSIVISFIPDSNFEKNILCINNLLLNYHLIYNFEILIKEQNEINFVNEIMNRYNKIKFKFVPVFDNNFNFFKENIFINEKDICKQKLNIKQISLNKFVNKFFYKNLFILPDGSVFSNLNKKRLGNISKFNINELIYKEVTKNRNWFDLRKNHIPCKSCIYNLLCPPISNYESIIGKMNLCNINLQ